MDFVEEIKGSEGKVIGRIMKRPATGEFLVFEVPEGAEPESEQGNPGKLLSVFEDLSEAQMEAEMLKSRRK